MFSIAHLRASIRKIFYDTDLDMKKLKRSK